MRTHSATQPQPYLEVSQRARVTVGRADGRVKALGAHMAERLGLLSLVLSERAIGAVETTRVESARITPIADGFARVLL